MSTSEFLEKKSKKREMLIESHWHKNIKYAFIKMLCMKLKSVFLHI